MMNPESAPELLGLEDDVSHLETSSSKGSDPVEPEKIEDILGKQQDSPPGSWLLRDLMTIAYIHPLEGFKRIGEQENSPVILDTQWLFSQLSPNHLDDDGTPTLAIVVHLDLILKTTWRTDKTRRKEIIDWFKHVHLKESPELRTEVIRAVPEGHRVDHIRSPTFEDCYGNAERRFHPQHIAQMQMRIFGPSVPAIQKKVRGVTYVMGHVLRGIYFSEEERPLHLRAEDFSIEKRIWDWFMEGKPWGSKHPNPKALDLEAEAQKNVVEYLEQPITRIGENLEEILAGEKTQNIPEIMTLLKPHVPVAFELLKSPASVTTPVDRFVVNDWYFQRMQTALTTLRSLDSTDSLTTFLNMTKILPTRGRRKMRLWAAGVGHPPTLTFSDFYFAYEPGQELVLSKLDYADFRYFLLNPEEGTYDNGAVHRGRLLGSHIRCRIKGMEGYEYYVKNETAICFRDALAHHLPIGSSDAKRSLLRHSFLWSIRSGDLDIPDSYWQWILHGYDNEFQDGSNMLFDGKVAGPTKEKMQAIRAEAEEIQKERQHADQARREAMKRKRPENGLSGSSPSQGAKKKSREESGPS